MKRHFPLFLLCVGSVMFFGSYFVFEEVRAIIVRGTQLDSIGHIVSFFLLTSLVIGVAKLPLVNSIITLSLYAALTELGQYYLGFRNGEVSDFFSDLFGIALFMFLKLCFAQYKKNSCKSNSLS